jgi:transcription antitermination factor NusG
MALQWYALRSKPRKEETIWRQMNTHGFEVFYPCLRVKPVNPRSRKIRPYFPGYLFVHADLQEVGLSAFQWTPHAVGLVCFGGEPAIVPDALIYSIQQRMRELQHVISRPSAGLHSGDKIRIQEGPFHGYEAIFDAELPGSERVRVLLKLLSDRYVPVEMAMTHIQRT